MDASEHPRKRLLETLARWAAAIITALFCAASVISTPFGCAVGEFEEDRNCSPAVLSWVSVALLVATIVVSGVTKRRSLYWIGIAVTLLVAYAGAVQA